MKTLFFSRILFCCFLSSLVCLHGQTIFFQEGFEDNGFKARGWYDNLKFRLSTDEHRPGGNSAIEFHFLKKGTTPESGSGSRHKFPESDEVYISYYVKYSANWTGSNKPYHPHEFHVTTNLDPDYVGPAFTHLTLYIEQNEGKPLLALQDGVNIDTSRIGQDLTAITENRSVAGCNGDGDGYGPGDCYLSGTLHFNGKGWRTPIVYFRDDPGPYYKNDWHHVEAYFKLNSIQSDKGIPDGTIQYWYDGETLIEHHNVLLRTGQHPDMKFNQFLVAPYIGDGSPIDQTMWVDDLTVASSRPTDAVPDKVILISPEDKEDNNLDFRWEAGTPDITFYWIQIAKDKDFHQLVINDSALQDTTYDKMPFIEGDYWWHVRARNTNGWSEWSAVRFFSFFSLDVQKSVEGVPSFSLTPNPAGSSVLLSFELPALTPISLKLYTLPGCEIATIVEGMTPAGRQEYRFNSSGLATGTYYVRLTTPGRTTTHLLNILR